MRRRRNRPDLSPGIVERVLRAAAEWEPAQAPPASLMRSTAGLGQAEATSRQRRLRTVRLGAAVAACSLSVLCAMEIAKNEGGQQGAHTARLASPPTASRLTSSVPPDVSDAAVQPDACDRGRAAGSVSTTPAARSVKRLVRRHSAPKAAARHQHAPIWRDHTVRRYVSGLSMPGYLITRADDGTTVLLPAVAEVTLAEQTGSWTTDAVKPVDYIPVSYQSEGGSYE